MPKTDLSLFRLEGVFATPGVLFPVVKRDAVLTRREEGLCLLARPLTLSGAGVRQRPHAGHSDSRKITRLNERPLTMFRDADIANDTQWLHGANAVLLNPAQYAFMHKRQSLVLVNEILIQVQTVHVVFE